MKYLITIIIFLFLISCGNSYYNQGKEYECYGLIDKDQIKDNNIKYNIETGNLIWSVLGFETAILPIWLMGYRLYCPYDTIK